MRIFRSMSVVGAAIVISAGVVTLPLATHAAAAPAVPPGAIDQNFGAFGGQAAFGSGITSALDSVEMDSKQRIIAAAAGGGTLFIYRLTSTGTLDSSFGPDGTFTWANAAGNGGDPVGALAVDAQDRVYVTGGLSVPDGDPQGPTHKVVAILRLTAAGAPDPTWGTGGVVTYDHFGANPNDHGTSLALDESQNRLYVGAWEGPDATANNHGTDFAVLAYKIVNGPNTQNGGDLDTSFGTGGVATQDFNGGNDTVRDIAVIPASAGNPTAHNVVAVGFVHGSGTGDDTGLWMLTPGGNGAPGFGDAQARVETDIGNGAGDGARSVSVDSHGRIFVSGTSFTPAASGFVAAYTSDGNAVAAFNRGPLSATGGLAPLRFDGTAGSAGAGITVDAQGRVVVVGGSTTGPKPGISRFALGRYAADTVFRDNGQETLPTCKNNVNAQSPGGADGVTTQADGMIVVTGVCDTTFAVWRIGGGHRATLPATPTTPTLHATAANITVDGADRTVTVAPHAAVKLKFDYHVPTQPAAVAPQLLTGLVNSGPEQCIAVGPVDANNGADGSGIVQDFTAPDEPGIYYLALDDYAATAGCESSAELAQSWTGDGQPWGAGAPPPAQYLAEVIVDFGTSVQLSSSYNGGNHVPAAAASIPVDSLDTDLLTSANALNTLATAPLRTSPLRTSPLRTSPLRTSAIGIAPLRTSPLDASPLRTSPLRTSPLRTSPLRTSGFSSVPPIPLSDVPLTPPLTWTSVLTGTIYANQPLQNVTLQQIANLDPTPNINLSDIDLSRTPLRNITLTAFLLGDTPLSALNAPAPAPNGWAQFTPNPAAPVNINQSLIDLEVNGATLSSYYTAAEGVVIPTGTTNTDGLVNAPLSTIALSSLWLEKTPFGALPASAFSGYLTIPATCSPCSSLADVQQADPVNGINDSLTIGAVIASGQWPAGATVNQILPGLVSLGDLPLTSINPAAIAVSTPLASPFVTFTASLTIGCTAEGNQSVRFDLPPQFRYKPDSATLTVDGGAYAAASAPLAPHQFSVATSAGAVTLASTPPVQPGCATSRTGTATIQAEPGIVLGPAIANAEMITSDADVSGTDPNPVVVDDTPPPAGPQAATSTLYIGHLTAGNAQDVYRFTAPVAGTQVAVTLGRVPVGQDYDLSFFGPPQPDARSPGAKGSQLHGAPQGTGVADTSLAPGNDDTAALPEPQTDVPVTPPSGSSVWGVSDNRGSGDESLNAVVPDGVSGELQVVVSGFNGSSSDDPYSLLVQFTPPTTQPCVGTTTGSAGEFPANMNAGARSAAPAIPATTQTLILTNQERWTGLWGTTGWQTVSSSLNTLAARSDVKGVVVPVDGNQAVHDAYVNWDAHPCSSAAADRVVIAINTYVDQLRTGAPDLRSIVIAGTDLIVPMMRVVDHVATDNEQTFANDQIYNGTDNQLSAALRDGYLLTDDPYGDFDPIPWLDGQAFVPDVALGRLVETPNDIKSAVDAFGASNGVRTPNSSYTSGYDFNADGAQQVANTLAPRVPAGAAATSINGSWTKTDAVNGIATANHGFISVNAHYDAYRALPANEFSQGTQNQLLKSTDLPSSLSNSVLFTIGCHAGLSVADTFVNVEGGLTGAPAGDRARIMDWPQSATVKGGLYAGNTGYGYGDDATVAYSEKLMAAFANNLDGTMTVGQALMAAKHAYLHLPLAAVDGKVMEEATFYGLPMYRIGATGVQAPASLPTTPAGNPSNAPSASGSVQTADFTSAAGRHLVPQQSGAGTYYQVQTGTGTPEPPLAIPAHPLEPQTSDPVAAGPSGTSAHGVLITGLKTHVVPGPLGNGLIDPVYSSAVPDGSSLGAEPNTIDAYFPATIAGLVQRGGKDAVLLNPGQFRASGRGGLGFQQLDDQLQYQVIYSSNADFTPPSFTTVNAVVDPITHQPTFTVTTSDNDVVSATVLYLPNSGSTATSWQQVVLTGTQSNHKFVGTDTNPPTSLAAVPQYVVQLVDAAGNTAESKSKGQDWTAQTAAVGNAPQITLGGALTNGVYAGAVSITLSGGTPPLTVQVDRGTTSGSSVPYTGPFVVTAAGTYTVTAMGSDNQASVQHFTIAPFASLGTDVPTITAAIHQSAPYIVGQSLTLDVSCADGQGSIAPGGANCFATPSTLDNSFGQHTAVVTAISRVSGLRVTRSVDYSVQYVFNGFQQPVNDPVSVSNPASIFKINSTIPLKFQLQMRNSSGALIAIPDATAAAIANNCLAVLSYAKLVGQNAGAVDESVYTSALDSGGCFRYDATAHQFIYNLSSKELNASSGNVYNVKARLSLQGHDVNIGLK